MLGMVLFVGSIILGLPVFGIGWHEPHPQYPDKDQQLVGVPGWLGIIGASGMGLFFVGVIVSPFRER
jgi:hypothetical protein